MEVRDVAMDFLYGEAFTESSPEAYERLILDVLLGDATLFPRNAEVEASWRVIDPLEEFWAGQPPDQYRAGEWGPKAADEMLARDGRQWRRPMTTLWDTTGTAVVKALAAERRTGGAVTSGLALTLVVVIDEKDAAEAEAAATIAASQAPDAGAHGAPAPHRRAGPAARRRGVDRRPARPGRGRRAADVRPAGAARRVGHAAAARAGRAGRHLVVRRDARGHRLRPARRVRRPPDHRRHPRRPTRSPRCSSAPVDYAPGDTDLTWTVITPWRAALASAFDTVRARRPAVTVPGNPVDPSAQLLAGWLSSRLGHLRAGRAGRGQATSRRCAIDFADGHDVEMRNEGYKLVLRRPNQLDSIAPFPARTTGDLLAEELRRLDVDETYAEALGAVTGDDGPQRASGGPHPHLARPGAGRTRADALADASVEPSCSTTADELAAAVAARFVATRRARRIERATGPRWR